MNFRIKRKLMSMLYQWESQNILWIKQVGLVLNCRWPKKSSDIIMGLDKRHKWVTDNEEQELKLWNYYFLFAIEFIWAKLLRSTSSSMISRQFWEKRQHLLTWHDTVFGGGIVMILRLVIERCYRCKNRGGYWHWD